MRILKESSPAISLPSGNQKGRKRSAKESPSETNEVQTSLCTNKSALFCLSWEVEVLFEIFKYYLHFLFPFLGLLPYDIL